MNIYEKLQQCRVELQELKLKKGAKNKFVGFEYYELADFLPAVNNLFNKHKLCSVFNIYKENDNEVARLTIVNAEKTDECLVFESPTADAQLKGCAPIQSLGGVHTYMKRYLYLNALEIVEPDLLDGLTGKEDDDKKPKDDNKKKPTKQTSQPTQPAETQKQDAVVYCTKEQLEILNRQDEPVKAFALKKFSVASLDKLTSEQATYIIQSMTEKGTLK